MKKIFAMGLMLVALALTNCAKNDEIAVVEENNVNLYANVDARTTNNGLSTAWASGDALTVFYAVNGTTTYSANTKFTAADAAASHFTGTATLAADTNYDWFAFYPYTSYMSDPIGSKGFMELGSNKAANFTQTQKGNNSMAHIAGAYFPLVGKALNVASDEAPVLTMSHASSLIEFEVNNTLDTDLYIDSIVFTSSEDINGTYYYNWAGDALDIKNSGASYVSATATLNVSNGEAIAAGAKATFYLAVKPHTVAAGKTLSITVNANNGTNNGFFEKSITTTAATTFSAGAIKTIPVKYNAEFVANGLALPFDDDFAWVTKDEDEYALLATDLDDKYLSATNVYGSVGELKFGASSKLGSIKTAPINLSQPFTVVFDAKAWSGDTSVVKVTVDGQTKATAKLTETYDKYMLQFDAATSASMVTIAFAMDATSTDASKHRGYIDNLEIVAGHDYVLPPVLTLTTTDLNVQAEEGTTTIGYSIKNPVDGVSVVATSNDEWITVTPGTDSFDVTVAENTGEEREGSITVTYGDTITETITVTQAAPKSDDVVIVEKAASHIFQNNATFKTWNSSYTARTLEFDEATVKFASANKQSSTITDMPVTKGGAVELIAKNGATIKNAKFTCKKWSSKAQTITMHYSTNGGSSYTSLSGTSTNFVIEKTDLPAGTNAVKITFNSTSNQVGIQQADITYLVEE